MRGITWIFPLNYKYNKINEPSLSLKRPNSRDEEKHF